MAKPLIQRLILGCLLAASIMAFSGDGAFAQYRRLNWEALDLSPSQESEFERLDEKWETKYTRLAPRIRANEMKLQKLMASPNPDKNEIMRLQLEINADKAQLKVDATDIHFSKRKLLTPGQQRQLMRQMNANWEH